MPKVSEAHLARKKNRVLNAARRCFLRTGIRETTMRQIIDESGMSAGAIYNYFPGKEALILALVTSRQANEADAVKRIKKRFDDPADELLAIGDAYFSQLDTRGDLNHRKLNLLIWAEGVTDADIGKLTAKGFDEPNNHITELVARLQEQGRLIDGINAEAFSRLLTAAYHGYVLQLIWGVAPSADEYAKTLRATLNSVLKPRPTGTAS